MDQPQLSRSAAKEAVLERFEAAWREAVRPRLLDFLPSHDDDSLLLHELVLIDLEHRWRGDQPASPLTTAQHAPPLLEDYLVLVPALAPLSAELVSEEYRIRRLVKGLPPHAEYRQRFPHLGDVLPALLDAIDAALRTPSSQGSDPAAPLVKGDTVRLPTLVAGGLVEVLRRTGIVDGPTADALSREFADNIEAAGVVRALLRRQVLTEFQADALLGGRGDSLRLGQYVLLRPLGEGGMGSVSLAQHVGLHRLVALKVIRAHFVKNAAALRRFAREMRAVARLNHPHISHAYDAGESAGVLYIAMEYLKGIDLARLVLRQGPLSVAEACGHIRQAALGLEHAARLGLVHRDIKPANLMLVESEGIVKVLDFGLALAQPGMIPDQSGTLTRQGLLVGTPDFMSPEQIHSAHATDTRSDLYSLGCTLFYLLSGQVPFPAARTVEKLHGHCFQPPLRIETLRPDVPPAVADIVHRLLAKQPADRFASCGELIAALDAVDFGATQKEIATPFVRRHRTGRGAGFKLLVAVLAGVCMVGLLVALLWPSKEAPGTPSPAVVERPRSRKPTSLGELPVRTVTLAGFPQLRLRGVVALLDKQRQAHWGAIRTLTLSKDGKLIASGGDDRVVRLTDAATFREFDARTGHKSPLHSLDFAADGGLISTSGFPEKVARYWEPKHFDERGALGSHEEHEHGHLCVAFSADGQFFVTGSWARLTLWRTDELREMRRMEADMNWVAAVAFRRDGKRIASGSNDKRARIWDIETGKEVWQSSEHGWLLRAVRFTPDGRLISCGGHDVYLWEEDRKEPVHRLNCHPQSPTSVAVEPHGRWAGVTLTDGSLVWWNLDTGREERRVSAHVGEARAVACSADGQSLVTGGEDGRLRRWDAATGKETTPETRPWGTPLQAAFAPDGKRVVLARADGAVEVWRPIEGETSLLVRVNANVTGPRFVGEDKVRVAFEDGSTRTFDTATGSEVGSTASVEGISWTDGTRHLLWGNKQQPLRILDVESGRVSATIEVSESLRSQALSADGKRAVLMKVDGTLIVWDVAAGRQLREIEVTGHKLGIAALTPDGGRALFFSDDRGLLSVNLDDGTTRVLESESKRRGAVTVSSDGRLWAAQIDGFEVRVWTVQDGKEVTSWALPGPVNALQFNSEGSHLLTANGNGTVFLLRVQTQR